MDQHDPTRRQYLPPSYAPQGSQQGDAQEQPGQYATTESVGRYRASYMLPPTSLPPTARAIGDAQQVYGFQPSPQYDTGSATPGASLQYQHDMQSTSTHRQQPQQFSQFAGSVLHGMTQAPQSQTAASAYDASHYRQRMGVSETMGGQFGIPQSGQYYLHGQAGQASAAAPELTTPQMSQHYQQSDYPQPGPSSASAYQGTMGDPSQPTAYSPYVQQTQYSAQQPPPPTSQPSQTDEAAFERFQAQLRHIFTLARDGTLENIEGQLLQATQYLLRSVEQLGLTSDDKGQHDSHIQIWDEFNHAWLVTLQRQLDLTEQMLNNGSLPPSQSIMPSEVLDLLGRELVRLCDNIERHGLVDYQMGVAEDEIIELLLRCQRMMSLQQGDRPAILAPQDTT